MVKVLGFRVQGSGSRVMSGISAWSRRCGGGRVYGSGFGVWGFAFGIWGLRFGIWGLGLGVWGLGVTAAFEPPGMSPHDVMWSPSGSALAMTAASRGGAWHSSCAAAALSPATSEHGVLGSEVRRKWSESPAPCAHAQELTLVTCCVGFGVQGGSGFRVQGSGFRVQGSGFRFQGAGCRVQVTCCVVSSTSYATVNAPENGFTALPRASTMCRVP